MRSFIDIVRTVQPKSSIVESIFGTMGTKLNKFDSFGKIELDSKVIRLFTDLWFLGVKYSYFVSSCEFYRLTIRPSPLMVCGSNAG